MIKDRRNDGLARDEKNIQVTLIRKEKLMNEGTFRKKTDKS